MLIRTRLQSGFLAIAGLVALLGAIAFESNTSLIVEVSRIVDSSIPEADGAAGMTDALLRVQLSIRDLLLWQSAEPQAPKVTLGANPSRNLRTALDGFEARLQSSRTATQAGLKLAKDGGEEEEIKGEEEELALLRQIEEAFEGYRTRCLEVLTVAEGKSLNVSGMLADLSCYESAYLEPLVSKYRINPEEELLQDTLQAKAHVRKNNQTLLLTVVMTLLGGLGLGYWLSRSILHPVGLLIGASERMARGQFNAAVNYSSPDELGQLASTFNRMAMDLSTTTVSKRYVDNIITSVADMLIVTGPDQTIRSANRAALELLGYELHEIVGKHVGSILRVNSIEPGTMLEEISRKGVIRGLELDYKTQMGSLIPVSFSASMLQDERGLNQGIVCVAQDIRARKQSEAELEEAQKGLLENSRKAGMAEVATSILHNVGNVLNSVNVSTTLVTEMMSKSKGPNLERVVALLEENAGRLGAFLETDSRGKQLPNFLAQLSAVLARERQTVMAELESMAKNLEHIREIVAVQQSYAKVCGVACTVKAAELVEDALRMNQGSLARHDIQVVREYETVPELKVEKHKVLQILVNLIRNAKYACDDSGRADKQINLRVSHGVDKLRISVADNGVGIPSENLTRIFNFGFTTRRDGHGFGLHSGALAAREMGGDLTARSDGQDRGATFVLALPLTPPE